MFALEDSAGVVLSFAEKFPRCPKSLLSSRKLGCVAKCPRRVCGDSEVELDGHLSTEEGCPSAASVHSCASLGGHMTTLRPEWHPAQIVPVCFLISFPLPLIALDLLG